MDVPQLTFMDTPSNRALIDLTPALRAPFVPTFWMRSAHAQTILGTLLRLRPPIIYQRDILSLRSDGGTLALDWDSGRNDPRRVRAEPHTDASPQRPSLRSDPILFLLPGLTGGSKSKYLCQCIEAARLRGWRSVIFNFRGIMIPMSTPRPSTGINIQDVQEALSHVHACYPRAPIVALGFSMGANMLVKTLGTMEGQTREYGLVASAAVSCAFDYVKLATSLDQPLNKMLYSRFLTMQLKRNYIKQKKSAWQHTEWRSNARSMFGCSNCSHSDVCVVPCLRFCVCAVCKIWPVRWPTWTCLTLWARPRSGSWMIASPSTCTAFRA